MTDEEKQKRISILESILFAYGEPVKLDELKKILGLSLDQTRELLNIYENRILDDPESGLFLIRADDEVQLGTKPQNHAHLEKFLKLGFRHQD